MRRPTSREAMYAWHRAALAGERPPTHEDEPQCGWFLTRYGRDCPWVPARIWLVQEINPETGDLEAPEYMLCTIIHDHRDPNLAWTWLAKNPITAADYLNRMAEIERLGREDPTNPLLSPRTPVDFTRRPTLPRSPA